SMRGTSRRRHCLIGSGCGSRRTICMMSFSRASGAIRWYTRCSMTSGVRVRDDGCMRERRLISSGSTFEQAIGYSRAVVDGEWVHVSGTTGFDYSTMTIAYGVVEQAEQC